MPFIPNNSDAGAYGPSDSRWQSRMDSTDVQAVVFADAGNGVESGCAVTAQGSPNNTVAVASGFVIISGARYAVTANASLSITAAHATLPRRDIVSVGSSGIPIYTAGTANADPVKPSLPSNHVLLAEVLVPATDTTISSDQIVDKRLFTKPADPRDANYDKFGRWFAALGGARTATLATPASIVFIGDSVVVGGFAGTYDERYTSILADALQRPFKETGSKFIGVGHWLTPWTFVGGSLNEANGLGNYARNLTTTSTTCTIAKVCDKVDLYFHGVAANGKAEVLVDNVLVATVETAGTANAVIRHTLNLTLANHSIIVRGHAQASNVALFAGAYFWAGDAVKGVQLWDIGHSGHVAGDVAAWTASGTLTYKALSREFMAPDLVVVEVGLNDLAASTNVSTFKTNVTSIITNIKAAVEVTPSIIIQSMWARCDSTYTVAQWEPYRNAMREVAYEQGCYFMDMQSLLGGGALHDLGATYHTGGTTSGTTLTLPDGVFRNPLDVGITVTGDGITGSRTISSITNGTTATLNSAVNSNIAGTARITLTNRKDSNILTSDGLHPSSRGMFWLSDEFSRLLGGVTKNAAISAGLADSAGQLLRATAADIWRAVPGFKYVNGDFNTTSTTMADIPGLGFNVSSGDIYQFHYWLWVQTAATTTGVGVDMNGPAGALIRYTTTYTRTPSTSASPVTTNATYQELNHAAFASAHLTDGIAAANTPQLLQIHGWVLGGATPGTVTPRFRTEIAASQARVTSVSYGLIV